MIEGQILSNQSNKKKKRDGNLTFSIGGRMVEARPSFSLLY